MELDFTRISNIVGIPRNVLQNQFDVWAANKKGGNIHVVDLKLLARTVPGAFYKFMQVLGVERVRKLFIVKEIAVLKFWDGIRGILAPDARKYKF